MKKSLFGLSENIVSAISYAGLFVTGIIVLLLERENKNVRFHAMQSTLFFAALFLIAGIGGFLLGWLPLLGGLVKFLLWNVVPVICWLFLMFAAYNGQTFKIPFIGDAAWDRVNK